ncbi:uncharacterized protein LOC126570960 isoform X2 [Anopheles aquasalis]|uniref:uncharacterized protein LOC126570960 isoform X2 n=1 Tax=Anopheles aquasalis TaxID=42839 RepID=UPI00215A44B2|nr:uncharacterized protein LOC126570960 isoform X2 [Anopheles aquasalis]
MLPKKNNQIITVCHQRCQLVVAKESYPQWIKIGLHGFQQYRPVLHPMMTKYKPKRRKLIGASIKP